MARQALAEAEAVGAGSGTLGPIFSLLGRSVGSGSAADDGQAHSHFERALALLPAETPTRHARAMALIDYGIYLANNGRLRRADACQSEARAIMERMGLE